MPTNRTRTSRARRAAPIDADDWAFLHDETPENRFTQFSSDAYWVKLWAEYGDEITQKWAQKHPGTRPTMWWKFSAPRQSDPEMHDSLQWLEPRLQIGGHPVEADWGATAHSKAIPDCDVDAPECAANPPVFESERAYLKRHGLLLPGEAGRCK